MKVFEEDAMAQVYYLKDHIYDIPTSRRVEIFNQIIQADDTFLVKLNTATEQLSQLQSIGDSIELGYNTYMIFAVTAQFFSTDFKQICITFRDSLENLPIDYFDDLGYFYRQSNKVKEIGRMNNSVADLQADFYKAHEFKDEDINEMSENCVGLNSNLP